VEGVAYRNVFDRRPIALSVNLAVMGAGAWYSAQTAPPIPEPVEGPEGETLATAESVRNGNGCSSATA
jgi:nitric oxide reductase large subunit